MCLVAFVFMFICLEFYAGVSSTVGCIFNAGKTPPHFAAASLACPVKLGNTLGVRSVCLSHGYTVGKKLTIGID